MSSGFITESEINEARRRRQEEWDRVRKADDPLEAPEQVYDPRSLYERLQEQKQRKELEYEEAHKLKNMIKGLDDDEIEFLDLVDRTKLAADRRKTLEEEKELNDYRNRVATLQEKTLDQKLQSEINTSKLKTPSNNRTSQTKLLKGVIVAKNENVKRKATNMDDSTAKKAKLEMESKNAETEKKDTGDVAAKVEKKEEKKPENDRKTNSTNSTDVDPNGGLQCIGILPGLGYYEESSSDECSSNSDMDSPVPSAIQLDLLGRKVVKKEKETKRRGLSKKRSV